MLGLGSPSLGPQFSGGPKKSEREERGLHLDSLLREEAGLHWEQKGGTHRSPGHCHLSHWLRIWSIGRQSY